VSAARYDRPIIGAVDAGSPAADAGLQAGDEIVTIDGEPQATWEQAGYDLLVRPDTEVRLEILRAGERREVVVHSSSTEDRVGTIGVYPLVRLGEIREGSAAQEAGLRPDDAIVSIGDQGIRSFADIIPLVAESRGEPLELRVYREGTFFSLSVAPRDDGAGLRLGIVEKRIIKQLGPVAAVREAVSWSWETVRLTLDIIRRLVTAKISPKTMMGPLGIAKASGEAARVGIAPLLSLMAVISLQLGILNLLPIPPLDGGHLAILAGESVVRRDFSMTVKMWIMNAGLAMLLLLIGLVVYSDLSKTSLLGRYLP
jgi:regulator of sigma E protease